MKTFLRKNLTLILAFALPMLLILGVAISTYLPSLFISTKYNFIYTICSDSSYYSYNCNDRLEENYFVQNNKLVKLPTPQVANPPSGDTPLNSRKYSLRLFLHDTQSNTSREISFEEGQLLTLDEKITSPDGVTVSGITDSSSNGFIFSIFESRSSFSYYLTRGKYRTKLNIVSKDRPYYYSNDFKFLGWILPGRN